MSLEKSHQTGDSKEYKGEQRIKPGPRKTKATNEEN